MTSSDLRNSIENYLREQVAQALKCSPSDLEVDTPLRRLGLDALLAGQLTQIIENGLEVKLPSATLLGESSFTELVAIILDRLDRGDPPMVDLPHSGTPSLLNHQIAMELNEAEQINQIIQQSGKSQRQSNEGFVAPRTPTEETLVKIWSDILKIERVGVLDNFFDLGGDSLLATQVLSRIQKDWQIELPMNLLFDEMFTIRQLAGKIDEELQTQPLDHLIEQADTEKLMGLLETVEALSEEEAQSWLEKDEEKNTG